MIWVNFQTFPSIKGPLGHYHFILAHYCFDGSVTLPIKYLFQNNHHRKNEKIKKHVCI